MTDLRTQAAAIAPTLSPMQCLDLWNLVLDNCQTPDECSSLARLGLQLDDKITELGQAVLDLLDIDAICRSNPPRTVVKDSP